MRLCVRLMIRLAALCSLVFLQPYYLVLVLGCFLFGRFLPKVSFCHSFAILGLFLYIHRRWASLLNGIIFPCPFPCHDCPARAYPPSSQPRLAWYARAGKARIRKSSSYSSSSSQRGRRGIGNC